MFSYPEPNAISSNHIYLSPFLLFNLGNPSSIHVSNIKRETTGQSHIYANAVKTAKEVTISRLASVITTDRMLQTAFLSGLRTYFESYTRVVKNGDLIAVPIDTILARTMYTPGGDDSLDDGGTLPLGKPNDVAWFKITALGPQDDEDFLIEPSKTRMIQSGIVKETCVPSSLPWREYLGLPILTDYGIVANVKPVFFPYAAKLHQYLSASISPLGASLNTTILVHSSKRGAGKASVVHGVAAQMGIHVFEISGYNVLGDNDAKTLGTLRARLERASLISPCVVLLKHLDAVAKKSEQDGKEGAGITSNIIDMLQEFSGKEGLIITATVADIDKLAESVRAKFKFEVEISVPSEAERKEIFRQLTVSKLGRQYISRVFGKTRLQFGFCLRGDVSIDTLALQSAGLTPPDLVAIVQSSKQKALARFGKYAKDHADTDMRDLILGSGGIVKISPDDFEDAIGEARQKYSDSIGAPRIPNVSWEDVGGLEGVKKEILDTIEMPLKYPQLFSSGMKKRSGILFYGPPGTGKTLLAKAIATTFSLNFFSVKGPELLNMYIGESEANVRKVFQKARDARPCVVFFDELDSVAPKRGNQGDSGGVMDRIVSQLLAELDGMSGSGGEGVFVVGATNRPDLLDEALLRPGRFDKMLYLGISDTHEKQQTILEALTRKFVLGPQVSLEQISKKCPFTYTGADFYAMCSDAMLNAMTRTTNEVDLKIKAYNDNLKANAAPGEDVKEVSIRWWFENVASSADTDVLVTEQDFDKAVRELIPSVSAEELRHYLRVRENFQGGKTKAKQGVASAGAPVDAITHNGQSVPVLDFSMGGGDDEELQAALKASLDLNGAAIVAAEEVVGPADDAMNVLQPVEEAPPVTVQDGTVNGGGVESGSGSNRSGNSNGSSGTKPHKNKGKGVSNRS